MKIGYIVSSNFGLVAKRVEVVRETEKTIWTTEKDPWSDKDRERKRAKETCDKKYFDNWPDARAWLVSAGEAKKRAAAKRLDDATKMLDRVLSMDEPT